MFEAISQAVQFTDNLIKTYPTVFHALVPIGTIGSLFIGYRNTTHIKTQASIQREIEQNRYNLQLFEHRKEAYTKFKSVKEDFFIVLEKTGIPLDEKQSISDLIDVTVDPIFLFTDLDNIPLIEFSRKLNAFYYNCVKLESLDSAKDFYSSRVYIKESENYAKNEKKINDIMRESSNIFDKAENILVHLPILYSRADDYMRSKLIVPKQAFTPPSPPFVKTQIEGFKAYFKMSAKGERLLMFLVPLICLIFWSVIWFLKLHPEIN